ncbi:tRNA dihydrouridine synthase DusB [Snodgrassella communis]|jgi:tRNA-dihydrouridine synthase B|uniref:tRNA dihydrouridine synthase DusB n=1 Tax=Snodgrassella communis TaxID=2946699 RepID=UPI000C1F18F5|nr:tRNA dihydrouridine synthase DusB [Snodgrassella communis]PIT22329.1 tRNA dihydrouridine synthase DusB [Snodgrassella communis]PIT24344.1 tRNA dihydrouridine synthase DusB [Snodgrassella communis]
MHIGCYQLVSPFALAPMAGITDKPFRQLCREFGAGWAVSEMITSNPQLQQTRKTLQRVNYEGENGIRVVQIAGSDPKQLADVARYNVARGAAVIDINMGCPAKKVCNALAGSALLQNESLVEAILQAVVDAVDVPVTLKTRLGWDDEHRNILTIAQIAEQAGITALAIHGRTRTQMYRGEASYDLISQVRQQVNLPVWVNGDITSPQKALKVWQDTGADGVMIGRAAQGQPWLFRDLVHYHKYGRLPPSLTVAEHAQVITRHIVAMHDFYGMVMGVRIARKHIGWYVAALPESEHFRRHINAVDNAQMQLQLVNDFLDRQVAQLTAWPCAYR